MSITAEEISAGGFKQDVYEECRKQISVKRTNELSSDDIMELVDAVKGDDPFAKDRAIQTVMDSITPMISRELRLYAAEADELLIEAQLAVWRALLQYDTHSKPASFWTYVYNKVHFAIMDEARKSYASKVGCKTDVARQMGIVKNTIADIGCEKSDEEETIEKVYQKLAVSEKRKHRLSRKQIRNALYYSNVTVVSTMDSDIQPVLETIANDKAGKYRGSSDVADEVEKNILKEDIQKAVEEMQASEKEMYEIFLAYHEKAGKSHSGEEDRTAVIRLFCRKHKDVGETETEKIFARMAAGIRNRIDPERVIYEHGEELLSKEEQTHIA